MKFKIRCSHIIWFFLVLVLMFLAIYFFIKDPVVIAEVRLAKKEICDHIDIRADEINERLEKIDRKLDKLEKIDSKLDLLLNLVKPPLPDNLQSVK